MTFKPLVGLGTQQQYEYDLFLQEQGHEALDPRIGERIRQGGPDPTPVIQGQHRHSSAATIKSTRNAPENLHETAGTNPATADSPTKARVDLHPNVTIAVQETVIPDSRPGSCRRRNQLKFPPLHKRPSNR